MAMAADQRMLAERAHQLEMQRHVVFGHGEEIAVGHLVEECVDLGLRRLRGDEVLRGRPP